jgi:hypothetical protein
VACPIVRGFTQKARPTLPSARSSSLRSAALQHVPAKKPIFVTGLLTQRLKGVALPSRSPALRVWLPSRRCKPSLLSEALLSFPRSWALPFRVLSRPCGSVTVSRECAAPALPRQTFRPGACASAIPAHSASGTFSPPNIFQVGVRPIPSWAFAPLGLSSAEPLKKRFPSSCPSRSLPFCLRRTRKPEPQGIPFSGPATPLFQGARTRLVFPTDCICHLFGA